MIRTRLFAVYRANFTMVLSLTILGLTFLAWSHRFIQDDAFIGFRYAYNLAHGNGLVWNDGERVEGYSNFLYTVAMSLPIRLGLDPVGFSFCFGLLTFALSLIFTYRLALDALGSRDAALIAVVLLGTNYTFSSFGTSGMETQLQASLFAASVCTLLRSIDGGRWGPGALITLSLLLSAALLTRLDSALLLAVVVPIALLCSLAPPLRLAERLATALYLLLPLCLLVGAWTFWKVRYYGDILPNTYYVKVSSSNSLARGATYVYLFFQSYWLILFPFLLLWFGRALFTKAANRALLIPLAVLILWLLYTVGVGGDFIEFRFLVPVLPLWFVLVAWIICVQIRTVIIRVVLVAVILVGSLHHAHAFTGDPLNIESISELSGHLTNERDGWVRIGQALGAAFDHDPGVTVAVTAGGAIPYYSRLRTIDMLGLNDRWVATNGLYLGSRPGHQRIATFAYLIERGANLIIAHPLTVDRGADLTLTRTSVLRFLPMLADWDRLPADVRILEIPIDAKRKLLALYLVGSSRVDAVIARHGWRSQAYDLWDAGASARSEHVQLLQAGTRVHFWAGEADGYLRDGWSGRDFGIRWSTGSTAAIVFATEAPGKRLFRIKMGRIFYSGRVQQLRVELNGTRIATLAVSEPDPKEYSVVLPADLLGKNNVLRFATPDTRLATPRVDQHGEPRLGIMVEWMQLLAENAES